MVVPDHPFSLMKPARRRRKTPFISGFFADWLFTHTFSEMLRSDWSNFRSSFFPTRNRQD
jgi:hypothetical protein